MVEMFHKLKEIEKKEKVQLFQTSCQFLALYHYFLEDTNLRINPSLLTLEKRAELKAHQVVFGNSFPFYFFDKIVHCTDIDEKQEETADSVEILKKEEDLSNMEFIDCNAKDEKKEKKVRFSYFQTPEFLEELDVCGITNFKTDGYLFHCTYRKKDYDFFDLFSFPLTDAVSKNLVAAKCESQGNCHVLSEQIAQDCHADIYMGNLQYGFQNTTLDLLHSWCEKDGFVFDTLHNFVMPKDLHTEIYDVDNIIMFENGNLDTEEMAEFEKSTGVPYIVGEYCNYLLSTKTK